MAVNGTCSVEILPEGDRYAYHQSEGNEPEKLEKVLAFCSKLHKAIDAFFGTSFRADNDWWTEPLKLEADDLNRVAIEDLVKKANAMLEKAAVTRSQMAAMKTAKIGAGVVYFQTGDAFPEATSVAGNGANDVVMSFKAEPETTVGRIYWYDGKGVLHCSGFMDLLANDNYLVLSEPGVTDSSVRVRLKVDFQVS